MTIIGWVATYWAMKKAINQKIQLSERYMVVHPPVYRRTLLHIYRKNDKFIPYRSPANDDYDVATDTTKYLDNPLYDPRPSPVTTAGEEGQQPTNYDSTEPTYEAIDSLTHHQTHRTLTEKDNISEGEK